MKLRLPLCICALPLAERQICYAALENARRMGPDTLPLQQAVSSPPLPQAQDTRQANFRNMASAAHADTPPPPFVPPEDLDLSLSWQDTINSMIRSGRHKWGFLVYRTSYDDEAAWQRYLHILYRTTWIRLNDENLLCLFLYLSFTPMEDRSLFEGAYKDRIREHFKHWISTRSVERDGPGADHPNLIELCPRYRVCMSVDKEILNGASIDEFLDAGFWRPLGTSQDSRGADIIFRKVDGHSGVGDVVIALGRRALGKTGQSGKGRWLA